jgi:low temperature requirement protein LtrA
VLGPALRPRPPALRYEEGVTSERHASWLELFYDLVFVVAVAQLAGILHDEPDLGGIARFAALSVPVIWLWMNFTFYADQFDTDDVVFRLAIFLAMAGVAALAVSLDDLGTAFVVAFVLVRLVIIFLYARAGRHVPAVRNFCFWCVVAYAIGAACFAVSLLVPEPGRYALWALGLLVEMGFPIVGPRAFAEMPVHASHLPERYGLFTIIVFGESIVVAALSVSGQAWSFDAGLAAALGFALTCGLWWLYFGGGEGEGLRARHIRENLVFIYVHIPLLAAFAALAVGVELAIEHPDALDGGERALLGGGLAVSVAALTAVQAAAAELDNRGLALRGLACVVAAGLAVPALPPLVLLGGLLALITVLVVVDASEPAAA